MTPISLSEDVITFCAHCGKRIPSGCVHDCPVRQLIARILELEEKYRVLDERVTALEATLHKSDDGPQGAKEK